MLLNLDFNNIGIAGGTKIAAFFEQNSSFNLVSLSLGNNNLGTKGSFLIIKAILLNGCKLKDLKLQFNAITNDLLSLTTPLAAEVAEKVEKAKSD